MDVRMQEFLDKIDYVNWMWGLKQVGVPAHISFEATQDFKGNSFYQTCLSLLASEQIYGVDVSPDGNKCDIFVAFKWLDVADIPSDNTLVFSGERYDKVCRSLVDTMNDMRADLVESAGAVGVTVGKVKCDFDAVMKSINGCLTQRIYDTFTQCNMTAWIHGTELTSPIESDMLPGYNPVVYNQKTENYRLLKPIMRVEFVPLSIHEPARGSVAVRVENSMCKDNGIAKSLRTAIWDAIKVGVEQYNLEIENTFIYLGDTTIS